MGSTISFGQKFKGNIGCRPKLKYLRITSDERMQGDNVHLSSVAARAEASCHYDLDDVDMEWLRALNGERSLMGHLPVSEEQLERVMEELERRCWDRIQSLLKAEEGLGIEYDENVICDVCRSVSPENVRIGLRTGLWRTRSCSVMIINYRH